MSIYFKKMKLLRFLLFPFAILYDIVTSIRNCFFDIGILKSTEFDIPVIAVGNLSVGGTGKTPQIEYLIRLLNNDYKIAVLSRGYKRKTNGFIQLNSSHSAEDVGDEPLQFFKKFGSKITVAVDANRTNGIQQLLQSKNPPEIVLLDDAYQHRKVKAKGYILLTKYDDLFSDDFLLPTGNLRESKRGANRAACIVVTKCPLNLSVEEQKVIRKKLISRPNQEVFFSTIAYDNELKGIENTSINNLKNKDVLLVTGIANPTSLLHYLTNKNIRFKHLQFPDHHNFSTNDIAKINEVFNNIPSNEKIMLTTEKDFVRLENKLQNLCYIRIKTQFLTNAEKFNSLINSIIKS